MSKWSHPAGSWMYGSRALKWDQGLGPHRQVVSGARREAGGVQEECERGSRKLWHLREWPWLFYSHRAIHELLQACAVSATVYYPYSTLIGVCCCYEVHLVGRVLDHRFVVKECNSGIARWKRCIGQGMGKEWGVPMPLAGVHSPWTPMCSPKWRPFEPYPFVFNGGFIS